MKSPLHSLSFYPKFAMLPIPFIVAGIAAGVLITRKNKKKPKLSLKDTIPYEILCNLPESFHANSQTKNDGRYLIEHAICCCNREMLKALIENGADVNGHSNKGNPFLLQAVQVNSPEIVQMLIQAGASPNLMDAQGKTPLFYISDKDTQILELLLKAGADINARDLEGKFAIFKLINEDLSLEVLTTRIELMSKYNANFNIRNKQNKTPLFFAKTEHNAKLIQNVDVNIQDNNGKTVLFYADNEPFIRYLIGQGAKTNIKDNSGKTPLFYTGTLYGIKLLHSLGADIHAVDNKGKSLIFGQQNPEILEYLLIMGLDVNARDNEGKTALFYSESLTTQKILLDYGIDTNIADKQGHVATIRPQPIRPLATATQDPKQQKLNNQLDYAVTHNEIEDVKKLLKEGADPNYRHKHVDQMTMLQVAMNNRCFEIIRILIERGAHCSVGLLNKAIEHKDEPMLHILLNAGVLGTPSSVELAKTNQLDETIIKLLSKHLIK